MGFDERPSRCEHLVQRRLGEELGGGVALARVVGAEQEIRPYPDLYPVAEDRSRTGDDMAEGLQGTERPVPGEGAEGDELAGSEVEDPAALVDQHQPDGNKPQSRARDDAEDGGLREGDGKRRQILVVNRHGEGGRHAVTLREIEHVVEVKPKSVIPFQPALFTMVAGATKIAVARRGKFTDAIAGLALELSGRPAERRRWWRAEK